MSENSFPDYDTREVAIALCGKLGRRYDHLGTGFVIRIRGIHFLVSAAHVAKLLDGKSPIIRTRSGYHMCPGMMQSTLGDNSDKIDVAFLQPPPELVERLAHQNGIVDMRTMGIQHTLSQGDFVAISGVNNSKRNKGRVFKQEPVDTILQQVHVADFARLPSDYKLNHLICCDYHESLRYKISPEANPYKPNGMSGGPVYLLGHDGGEELIQCGLIGLFIEYVEMHRFMAFVHVDTLLAYIFEFHPHLAAGVMVRYYPSQFTPKT